MQYLNVVLMLLLSASTSFAQGGGSGHVGGGGDDLEGRVNDIRADLLSWIAAGGAHALELPAGITYDAYEQAMLAILIPKKVIVSFTDDQVMVEGKEKTCRGEKSAIGSLSILCNRKRFKETAEGDQYWLVHHEYAGLAGIEQNTGAASDYEISRQLTGFLEPRSVLRLVVKPVFKPSRPDCTLSIDQENEIVLAVNYVSVEPDGLSKATEILHSKGYLVSKKGEIQLTYVHVSGKYGEYADGYSMLHPKSGFQYRETKAILPIPGIPDPRRVALEKQLAATTGVNEYEAVKHQIEQTQFNDQPGTTVLEIIAGRLPTCEQFYKGGR